VMVTSLIWTLVLGHLFSLQSSLVDEIILTTGTVFWATVRFVVMIREDK
jgi:hypothetical protein